MPNTITEEKADLCRQRAILEWLELEGADKCAELILKALKVPTTPLNEPNETDWATLKELIIGLRTASFAATLAYNIMSEAGANVLYKLVPKNVWRDTSW